MANVAGLMHGPDGTPSQEALDAMIAGFEYVPPTELVKAKVAELKRYIADMAEAEKKKDKQAYLEIKAKLEEKKAEIEKWLQEVKDSIQEKINEIVDPVKQNLLDMIPEAVKSVVNIDLESPSITPNVSLDISTLENIVLALAYPYQPIIKVFGWWIGHFSQKMLAYAAKRAADVGDMIKEITSLEIPEMPTEFQEPPAETD